MAIDLKLSHSVMRLARKLAAGTTVEQEGVFLCAVIEDGIEKAALVASPAGTEKVIGYTLTADSQPSRTSAVEAVTVPASGTYEVQLRNAHLVSGRLRVVDALGVARTVDTTYAGTPASGAVKVDLAAGKLKFNSADASAKMTATYHYDLTLEQSKQLFGERFVNNRGLHAIFGEVELAVGAGEVFTDQFDSAQDYSSGTALKLGANGIITTAGSGPTLDATVIAVPSQANGKLGVRFAK